MQKRWKPTVAQKTKTRTLVAPDDLWEYARAHALGAGGLIRSLLEQDRNAREGRFREGQPELFFKTPAGFMYVTPRQNGFLLQLEDKVVLHYTYEDGQPWPVLVIPGLPSIPGLPTQVMSVCLQTDQIITIPLKRGQTVSIPTPGITLEQRVAEARARQELQKSPNTFVDGEEGLEGHEEAGGQ